MSAMSFDGMARPGGSRPRFVFAILSFAILPGMLLPGAAASAEDFPPDRIAAGASIFARNCSPCHGSRMQNPTAAFDLRTFPPDEHERFVSSVTNGKNQMPPWGDLLGPDDIEKLWAYVMAGENK